MAEHRSVSDKVVAAGGLKLLIKLMKRGSPHARALAAGTLRKLAIDIDLLVKLASSGSSPTPCQVNAGRSCHCNFIRVFGSRLGS